MAAVRGKVVQTEVDDKTYAGLAQAAERRGLTLKEAVRVAISEWAGRNIDLKNDPFFKLQPFKWKRSIPGERIDEEIYRERTA